MRVDLQVHRRRSIRLPAYDYRDAGAYFVTICTHEREFLFMDERFRAIAQNAWLSFVNPAACVASGDIIVMPNHVHGIIWFLGADVVGAQHRDAKPVHDDLSRAELRLCSDVNPSAAPLRGGGAARFSVSPGSLGAVVRAYKSFTAKRINRVRATPGAPVWQRNYYERVIRDDRELELARQYIRDNLAKWAEDKYNTTLATSARR